MNGLFNDILEKDEEIIKIIKPNKKRYWRSALIFAIPIFWLHLIILLVCTLFTLPYWYAKSYKNLYFAYTNKRLIIRSGIFGINYRSLEYKDLTSTSVNIGILDKACNTGTLTFASPSVHGKPIVWNNVENPYEIMKEIKDFIHETVAQ